MPDFDVDPGFEERLQQVLRVYSNEGVRNYDAVETTQIAVRGVPRAASGGRLPTSLGWFKPLLIAAVLALSVVALGVASGIIRLPLTDLDPPPSLVPFSPPPALTFEPTLVPASAQPTEGPTSTRRPAVPTAPPAATARPPGQTPAPTAAVTSEPPSPIPTDSAAPTLEPTAEPTSSPTTEPTPEVTPTPEPEPTVEPAATEIAAVDQGDLHACALTTDGRVFCWGENDYGELGDGTRSSRQSADVPVVGIDDAVSVAAGIRFSCAAMGDGTVSCWGEDPGSDGWMDTPLPVPNVDDAATVTAGGAHACALRRGGSVVCWGLGNLGQLGNGDFDNGSGVAQARPVTGIGNAVEISAGWNHTCARTRAGTISCWGGNGDGATAYGQLGDGTYQNRAAPVEVGGISDAVDVSAGGWTSCAVLGDGTVWCWGYGGRGGLGNGERSNSPTPVQVSGISDASRVVVGRFHACAQRSGGVISCWGDVGWGSGGSSAVPVDGRTSISSAVLSSDRSLLIVDRSNRVRAWGLGADEGPQVVPIGP